MDFDQTHMDTSFGQGNKYLGFGDFDPIFMVSRDIHVIMSNCNQKCLPAPYLVNQLMYSD